MLKSVFTILFLVGLSASPVSTSMPSDVMVPYKAYNQAIADKNYRAAQNHAYAAWKAAEDHLGDHKSTGDLAMNYAELGQAPAGGDPNNFYNKRKKAIERAIDLARFYGEDSGLIEVQRRIDLVDMELTFASRKITVSQGAVFDKTTYGKIASIKKLQKAIKKHELENSTFDADAHALLARYYQLNQRPKKALKYADAGIDIFRAATDGYASQYAYLVHTYKGNSHRDIALKSDNIDQMIKAALAYQAVMQNEPGDLPDTHSFIKTASIRWLMARTVITDAGRLEDAKALGLCDCLPLLGQTTN